MNYSAPDSQKRRISRMKEKLNHYPYEICLERAKFYTEVNRQNEEKQPAMKSALSLSKTLKEMPIFIEEEELIVGHTTSKNLAPILPLERGDVNAILEWELNDLPFQINDKDKELLNKTLLPYWKGKSIRDWKARYWEEEGLVDRPVTRFTDIVRVAKRLGIRELWKLKNVFGISAYEIFKVLGYLKEIRDLSPTQAIQVFDLQSHLSPNFEKVIKRGFNGIKEDAQNSLFELGNEGMVYEKEQDFLKGVITTMEASIDFAYRYKDLANEMAEREPDAKRKSDLLGIGKNCARVPVEPARTFYEAVQSLWLAHVIADISYGTVTAIGLGRIDQYLYPFYKNDLQEKKIDKETALELIEELFLKLSLNVTILPKVGREYAALLGADSNTVVIGGTTPEGEEASNELSYLCLEAFKKVKPVFQLAVRININTPKKMIIKALEANKAASGVAFYNDDVIIPALEKDGLSREDALDYVTLGCVELSSNGSTFACTAGNELILAKVLEMVLTNGGARFPGQKKGKCTGNPATFKSYDEFIKAFREQLRYNLWLMTRAMDLRDRVYAEKLPNPYISAIVDDCIKNGTDITRGGARYNFSSITGRGFATVVDSLVAVKKLVFEERLFTMQDLLKMLDKNFKGREKARQVLVNRAPKYGNGNEYADSVARELIEIFYQEVTNYFSSVRGGRYRPGIFTYGNHVLDGAYTGATPDGRKASQPLSNGISPSNNMAQEGPTAIMKSSTMIRQGLLTNGTALNFKLNPDLLEGEKVEKIASLLRTYFLLGGMHIQFNMVSTKTLKDAQERPEMYTELTVKVSGYSARFVDLGNSIQDDIIERSELNY